MRPACPGAKSQPLGFHMPRLPVGGLILVQVNFDNTEMLLSGDREAGLDLHPRYRVGVGERGRGRRDNRGGLFAARFASSQSSRLPYFFRVTGNIGRLKGYWPRLLYTKS